MNGKRRTPRAAAVPALEPADAATKKAKRLPMFGPGIVISVPLHLLPAYMELYGLEPTGWKNPLLLVKRIPKTTGKQEAQ